MSVLRVPGGRDLPMLTPPSVALEAGLALPPGTEVNAKHHLPSSRGDREPAISPATRLPEATKGPLVMPMRGAKVTMTAARPCRSNTCLRIFPNIQTAPHASGRGSGGDRSAERSHLSLSLPSDSEMW